jgi:predicted Zn-dependent protease
VLGAALNELQRGRPALASVLVRVRKGEFDGAAREAFEGGDQMAALFLRGLELYAAGNLDRAATQLRDVLRLAPDFAPAALYFGACFAAGGRDREAVTTWRRLTAGGNPMPIVYTLTAEALVRLGDTDAVITLLTQVVATRPEDDGARLRLAQAYAAAGRQKEALATVEPYLDRHPADDEALFVALQAIYVSRVAGQPVLGEAEAADRMATYGRSYATAKGPHQALVARWVAAMKSP